MTPDPARPAGPFPGHRVISPEEADRQARDMLGKMHPVSRFQVVIERRDTWERVALSSLLPTSVTDPAPMFVFRFIYEGREVLTFQGGQHIEMEAGAAEAFSEMVSLANRAAGGGGVTEGRPCPTCGGRGCEDGCGYCEMAHVGPDSHKVCRECGGTGVKGGHR